MGYLLDDLVKTAAPMFGKKRYIPRDHNDIRSRLLYEAELARYKRYSAGVPDYPESEFLKAETAYRADNQRLFDEKKNPKRKFKPLASLKSRYKYSKQENIDRDMAERAKDAEAKKRMHEYINESNDDGVEGWWEVYNHTPVDELEKLRREAIEWEGRVNFKKDGTTEIRPRFRTTGRFLTDPTYTERRKKYFGAK